MPLVAVGNAVLDVIVDVNADGGVMVADVVLGVPVDKLVLLLLLGA